MQWGIRAHDIQIYDDIDALSIELKELGANYIQFAPRVSLKDTTKEGKNLSYGLANEVKKKFNNNGINISILGCYVNIIHPDIRERKQVIQQFKDYLAYAKSFGAGIVATETGSVDNSFRPLKENYSSDIVNETILEIRKLVEEAEKLGVLIGIEPGVNHPIHDIETTLQVLKDIDSPNLKIILDPMNLVVKPEDDEVEIVSNAISLLKSNIYAFHIKDYDFINGEKKVAAFGKGIAPLEQVISQIKDFQKDPYIILDETPQEGFAESINNFLSIIK
ncbi:sugar phosphate isomerase/epimerase family protein [Ligilactobacillus salivarius]|uniref:sugar phosphate isomerase/epimerase family protein n=1 Tax=Ligilactobacillus salivarius TaxID=1624 RepID=UPI0009D9E0D7|nr:sugar phosphate isomerase/epimerase family protein [Ligilactobacillus salivarius]OQR00506.1 hypothetical protein B6U48_08325 [Ligilactobacillus salivarius]